MIFTSFPFPHPGQPGVTSSPVPGASGLDLSELEGKVREFLEAGLAESTKRVYRAGWKWYIAFAGSVAIPAVPITSESVTLFAAFLGAEGLAISTIESYLAALRHVHLLTNPSGPAPSWHSPHMKVLLRGIRRVQAQHSPARVRLPITSSLMRCIKAQLAKSPSSHMSRLIWAACFPGTLGSSGAENSTSGGESLHPLKSKKGFL